jgi:hypothetical protein
VIDPRVFANSRWRSSSTTKATSRRSVAATVDDLLRPVQLEI